MKYLNNVCLITIDGRDTNVNFNKLNNIIDFCNQDLKFKYSIHLTNSLESNFEIKKVKNTDIQLLKIPKLHYFQYNIFCIEYLYSFIRGIPCDYFLLIQDDGFIINPEKWTDDFLNFDYIGAPWINNPDEQSFGWVEKYGKKAAVGNGGFSLRSKKLIEYCSQIKYNTTANEDVLISAILHDYFCGLGIKYADIKTAAKFSLETKTNEYNSLNYCFGFHGKHNLNEVKKILESKGIFDVL